MPLSEETNAMKSPTPTEAKQIAEVASTSQKQNTAHIPKAVTVVLSEDTLVIALHDALTPTETNQAKSAGGAVQVQEFHRQLFAGSSEALRQEIKRITSRPVGSSMLSRSARWCRFFARTGHTDGKLLVPTSVARAVRK